MNPYQSREIAKPTPRPRPIPAPIAGRAIRVIATGIDFVLLLTLNLALCGSHIVAEDDLEDLCGLIPYLFLVVYEVGLGTSIGKQLLGLKVHFEYPGFRYRIYRTGLKYVCIPFIVYPSMLFTTRRQGLHEKAARSVVVQPNGWRAWIRASMGIALSAYAMATFGCGRLIGTVVRGKYDLSLVGRKPDPWVPDGGDRADWHRVWRQGGSFELPAKLDGLPLRGTPYPYFFGSFRGPIMGSSRAAVLASFDSHPVVELCRDSAPAMRWFFPCEMSPREFQSSIFLASTGDELFLNPRSFLRENALRLTKNFLLEGDEILSLRSYDGPEFSVVWHSLKRHDEDGSMWTMADHVYIAGDRAEEHYGITIVWSGPESDQEMVSSLISSFRFDRGSEELATSLLAEGRRARSPLELLNAIDIAQDKLPGAEALFALYAREGQDFEKRQFAIWVSQRVAEGDLRFMDLNEKVWDWRADEKLGEEE